MLAGVFLFTSTFGWAEEERLLSARTEGIAFSSRPAIKDKLAPPLGSESKEIKKRFLLGKILLSHKRYNEYIRKKVEEIGYSNLLRESVPIEGVENKVELIAIPDLLKFTGLPAHVGLGRHYGKPVVYIDNNLFYDDDIRQHELDEISRWETLRNTLDLNPGQMRDWIMRNIEKPIIDERLPPEYRGETSRRIAEIIHGKCHPIGHLYNSLANIVDFEYLTAYGDESTERKKDITIAAHGALSETEKKFSAIISQVDKAVKNGELAYSFFVHNTYAGQDPHHKLLLSQTKQGDKACISVTYADNGVISDIQLTIYYAGTKEELTVEEWTVTFTEDGVIDIKCPETRFVSLYYDLDTNAKAEALIEKLSSVIIPGRMYAAFELSSLLCKKELMSWQRFNDAGEAEKALFSVKDPSRATAWYVEMGLAASGQSDFSIKFKDALPGLLTYRRIPDHSMIACIDYFDVLKESDITERIKVDSQAFLDAVRNKLSKLPEKADYVIIFNNPFTIERFTKLPLWVDILEVESVSCSRQKELNILDGLPFCLPAGRKSLHSRAVEYFLARNEKLRNLEMELRAAVDSLAREYNLSAEKVVVKIHGSTSYLVDDRLADDIDVSIYLDLPGPQFPRLIPVFSAANIKRHWPASCSQNIIFSDSCLYINEKKLHLQVRPITALDSVEIGNEGPEFVPWALYSATGQWQDILAEKLATADSPAILKSYVDSLFSRTHFKNKNIMDDLWEGYYAISKCKSLEDIDPTLLDRLFKAIKRILLVELVVRGAHTDFDLNEMYKLELYVNQCLYSLTNLSILQLHMYSADGDAKEQFEIEQEFLKQQIIICHILPIIYSNFFETVSLLNTHASSRIERQDHRRRILDADIKKIVSAIKINITESVFSVYKVRIPEYLHILQEVLKHDDKTVISLLKDPDLLTALAKFMRILMNMGMHHSVNEIVLKGILAKEDIEHVLSELAAHLSQFEQYVRPDGTNSGITLTRDIKSIVTTNIPGRPVEDAYIMNEPEYICSQLDRLYASLLEDREGRLINYANTPLFGTDNAILARSLVDIKYEEKHRGRGVVVGDEGDYYLILTAAHVVDVIGKTANITVMTTEGEKACKAIKVLTHSGRFQCFGDKDFALLALKKSDVAADLMPISISTYVIEKEPALMPTLLQYVNERNERGALLPIGGNRILLLFSQGVPGDSGAPFIVQRGGKNFVVALLSEPASLGCCTTEQVIREMVDCAYQRQSDFKLATDNAQAIEAAKSFLVKVQKSSHALAEGSPADCLETIKTSEERLPDRGNKTLFELALDKNEGIAVHEAAAQRTGFSRRTIDREFETLKALGIFVPVKKGSAYYRFSDMMLGPDENYTKTMINAICDIHYRIGQKGDERPLHRGSLTAKTPAGDKKDYTDIVKELVRMTILHQINIMQEPEIEDGRMLCHILEEDLLNVSQSALTQKFNKEAERLKSRERAYVMKKGESIKDVMNRVIKDHPKAIFDFALSSENRIEDVPGKLNRLVFRGSAGNIAQVEGILAALRALRGPREGVISTLKCIYAALKGTACSYEISPDAIDDPAKFAHSFIFDLPPAAAIPADELSKMNNRLLQLLIAA